MQKLYIWWIRKNKEKSGKRKQRIIEPQLIDVYFIPVVS